jgi:hypothetical protein
VLDCISPEDAGWVNIAKQLLQLQTDLDETLQPLMPGLKRPASGRPMVIGLVQGTLKLQLSSAAQRTKLGHLQPDLLSDLHQRGWKINAIQYSIQGTTGRQPNSAHAKPAGPPINLAAETISLIESASAHMEHEGLKRVLHGIAVRHQNATKPIHEK